MRLALAILALAIATIAQPADTLRFDVVSIKPRGPFAVKRGVSTSFDLLRQTPGRITGATTFRHLIAMAWNVKETQIVGPEWIASDLFDVAATMPAETTRDALAAMLRAMLVERSALQFHRETKETSGFALVQTKGGCKLRPLSADDLRTARPAGGSGSGLFIAKARTMAVLADFLTIRMGRPVVEETGLAGAYNIELHWPAEDPDALAAALTSELGLRLESRKVHVELFLIDSARRTPTEN